MRTSAFSAPPLFALPTVRIKTFEKAVEKTAESMGISAEELLTKFKNEGRVVTTGYGRSNLPGYTDEVSEISCHAKGAQSSLPLCPHDY